MLDHSIFIFDIIIFIPFSFFSLTNRYVIVLRLAYSGVFSYPHPIESI